MQHQITQSPSHPITLSSWLVPGVDNDQDLQSIAWTRALTAWLDAKRRKSGSDHTVAAYERDWHQFFAFAAKAPWMISGLDAQAWMEELEAQGAKATTINRKLAALSSFYTYVSEKFTFVGKDNVERSIFIDGHGNPRPNPFKRPDRHRVDTYGHSKPISKDTIQRALRLINQQSLTGARDFALIVTYIYTGRRSVEIANLRWGDIEENGHRRHYTYRGKGNKVRTKELPPPAYHAIRAFLKLTGRLETIKPGDYIFQPVHGDRAARLPNVDAEKLDPNRPISGSMINRIIKRRFVAAGCKPEDVHTHTLRHTAAALRWRDGDGEDLMRISEFLDHSSVSITQIYLSKQRKPIDDGWTAVEQLIMV